MNGANSVPVAPAYNQAPAAAVGQYADWGTRFAAFLIDALTLFAIEVVGLVLARISPAFGLLIILVQLGMNVWYAIQVGATGASPGMRVMGLKCVNEQTGEPIGGGLGVVRAIAHLVDGLICYIGYLFPLWDAKRQTLADKIMHTVVINVPKKPFSIQPK